MKDKTDRTPSDSQEAWIFRRRVLWLMFFRVAIASFFLSLAAVTQIHRAESYFTPGLINIYILTGTVYGITIIYLLLLRYFIRSYRRFAFFQIIVDQMLITALLFITGGVNSIFSFIYSISIISASIFLYLPGSVVIATLSSLLYSAVVMLQHFEIIFPVQVGSFISAGYSEFGPFYPIVVNVAAFYLVAFFSSFLAVQAEKSRKSLQEKEIDLENLEALNEIIIQSINSGLVTLDRKGTIVLFNPAAQRITGYSTAEVYMKDIKEVFPGLDDNAMAVGREIPREMRFMSKDARAVCLGYSFSALKDKSGDHVGNIMVFQDLTDVKKMEEEIRQMDKLAAVGRLASGIAHEVRNPLASISGSVQVLRKSLVLEEADRQLMDIVVRESDSLSMLISDFNEFARPDKKSKETFNLKTLIDDVTGIFKNSQDGTRVNAISAEIPESFYIYANYQQLRQVAWNLLINAAQAMPQAGGDIVITARKPGHVFPVLPTGDGKKEGCIELEFRDTGEGIPEACIRKIFDPFFTTKPRGTGLGLSIVYKIMEEHGGSISVRNIEGKGSSFLLRLPEKGDASVEPLAENPTEHR